MTSCSPQSFVVNYHRSGVQCACAQTLGDVEALVCQCSQGDVFCKLCASLLAELPALAVHPIPTCRCSAVLDCLCAGVECRSVLQCVLAPASAAGRSVFSCPPKSKILLPIGLVRRVTQKQGLPNSNIMGLKTLFLLLRPYIKEPYYRIPCRPPLKDPLSYSYC